MKYNTIILVGSFSIISCSSLRQVGTLSNSANQGVVSSNDSSWATAPLQTEDLRLLDQNPPDLWAGKPEVGIIPYVVQTKNIIEHRTDDNKIQILKTKGYRVQLFAGHEQDRALDIKAAAESRFGVSVYLVYEAPQYKVRAGNFVNRLQAEELCDSIKSDGFRDAWIVRSQVEIKQ